MKERVERRITIFDMKFSGHLDASANLLSGLMGIHFLFSGVIWPVRDADHSHPCSAEVKNNWSYNSTTPIRICRVDRETLPSTDGMERCVELGHGV